jgi:release factor glutamine methyltransferase
LNRGLPAYVFLVTVLEVIQRSTDFLMRKKVDSPRLQAELLLAHVLNLPRMQLYLNFEHHLNSSEQDFMRQLVKRRGEHEPLQHILGATWFCGLEIKVDRRVLIPRPETELLAEQGWKFLNERAKVKTVAACDQVNPLEAKKAESPRAPMALDFGTGSGCIAIALAVNCPAANVVALDIDPEALEAAQENASHHGVAQRIRFVLGQGLASFPQNNDFDLIIANPPYIPSSEIERLPTEVRDYDPRRALDGGFDGLDFYRDLAAKTAVLLTPGGKVMLEIGDGQADAVTSLFQNENWIVERIMEDYTQRKRILVARRPV